MATRTRAVPDLKQAIDIDAPIERVWAEITKLCRAQRALLNNVLESTLEPGDPLYYRSQDGKRPFVVGRVVEVIKPTRFAHTWILTMRDDEPTLVVRDLEARGADSTRVVLTHTGWQPDAKDVHKVDKTWVGILRNLKDVVEKGDVAVGTRVQYFFMRAFMFAMPGKTRTDRVAVPDWMPDGTTR
jgi:uncharacterized protein YndB with AHSA1/START domain